MRWRMNVTERQAVSVERSSLSDVVTLRTGDWPLYGTVVLTQSQARELAGALMAAGFDWSRDPAANPQVGP